MDDITETEYMVLVVNTLDTYLPKLKRVKLQKESLWDDICRHGKILSTLRRI